MQKPALIAQIKALTKKLGGAPGWKAVGHAGLVEDILRHWDYLSDALDDALGTDWRKRSPTLNLDEETPDEEPAPAGQRYSVYAIRLKKAVSKDKRFRSKNPQGGTKGCLYVGQTWHSPMKRFQQHMSGVRSGRFVRRFGLRLDEKLTEPHRNGFATRKESLIGESRYAQDLRQRGYQVWQQ